MKSMSVYNAGENYLEAVLILRDQREKVRAVDMARLLGVTKASVSKTLKMLVAQGYVNVELRAVTLTPEGEKIAKRVNEKYQVLQNFLCEFVGVESEAAKSEAYKMKHAMGDETLKKLQIYIKKQK